MALTRTPWMDEPSRRFFEIQPDAQFGMRLHDADLAVDKVLCAANRRQARDMVDLAEIARSYCPLGPLIWAAAAKSPFGPGRIVEEIRRNARSLSGDELRAVRMSAGTAIDPVALVTELDGLLDAAQAYVREAAPVAHPAKLFVNAEERPVEADMDMLAHGAAHALPCREFPPAPEIPRRP